MMPGPDSEPLPAEESAPSVAPLVTEPTVSLPPEAVSLPVVGPFVVGLPVPSPGGSLVHPSAQSPAPTTPTAPRHHMIAIVGHLPLPVAHDASHV